MPKVGGVLSKDKPVILTVIEYYLPGYRGGGTIRSLANLVDQLGDEFSFRIVTRDRDWRASDGYDVPIGEWISIGKAEVYYLPDADWSFWRLAKLFRSLEYDVLYLSSVFSVAATIWPLILRRLGILPPRPVLLGPRGELSAGAIAIRARKKRAYIHAAKALGLLRDVKWQASTPLEADDIAREIGSEATVVDAIDCSPKYDDWPIRTSETPKVAGELRVCFVSRISPKKNLEYAVAVVASLAGRVVFDIYGPVDDVAYWSRCEALLQRLPPNIVGRYCGARDHSELPGIFASYDLFLFPTHGENFGHVILEALAVGCPVLISDLTPWRNLEKFGVGADVPLSDLNGFIRAAQGFVAMDETGHSMMRVASRSFALAVADRAIAVQQNRSMLQSVLKGDI